MDIDIERFIMARKLTDKVNLNGGTKLGKGRGYNYLQSMYSWLPKVPTHRIYDHPNGGKTYFNYNQKLRDVVCDMVQYVCICKMIRTGMFKTHSEEFCKDFYNDMVAESYVKIYRGIGNWKLNYDLLRYVQCMINFTWLTLWTKYKEEQKVIKGIIDPNLHLSFTESMEMFRRYDVDCDDEQMTRLLEQQMNEVEDEIIEE